MRRLLWIACFFCVTSLYGQRTVRISLVNGEGAIQADLYGQGTRGVVLAHGGSFHKESWKDQAEELTRAGFVVLSVSFRGDRLNPDGSPGSFGSTADNTADVLAGVAYLHQLGVTSISAVGASMGGDAVGEADAKSPPGTFDRIVLLGSTGGDDPKKLRGRKLFIVARDDRSGSGLRLPDISSHYAMAPKPKKLVVLDGSAHAQFLFTTAQGPRVLREIEHFLLAP